jgi:hypothetical protein
MKNKQPPLSGLATRIIERIRPSEKTMRAALELVKQLQEQTLVVEDVLQVERDETAVVLDGPIHPPMRTVGLIQMCEIDKPEVSDAVLDYLNARLQPAVHEGDLAWDKEWFRKRMIGFQKGEGNSVRFALPRIGAVSKDVILGEVHQTVWNNRDHTAYALNSIEHQIEDALRRKGKSGMGHHSP